MPRIFRALTSALSLALFTAGCATYRIVPNTGLALYVEPFQNHSLEPQIEVFLTAHLKNTIAERPGFTLARNTKTADATLRGTILDCHREVDFFSQDEEVEMAAYRVKIAYTLAVEGKEHTGILEGVWHVSLASGFDRKKFLDNLADSLAASLYLRLVNDVSQQ